MISKKLVSYIDFFISEELHKEKELNLESAEKFRRQRLIITTSFIFGFLILFAFLSRLLLEGFSSSKSILLNLVIIPLFLLIGPLLSKFLNLQTVLPWFSLALGNFVIVMRSIDTGGIKSPIFLWSFVIPPIAVFLINLKASIIFLIIMIIEIIVFSLPSFFGLNVTPFFTPDPVQGIINLAMTLSFFAIGFFYEKQRRLNEVLIQDIGEVRNVKRRMSSLTRLSGGMAHEINNPLTILKNRLKGVSKNLKEGNLSQVEYSLERAQDSLTRIEDIIKKLRLFTKEEDINLNQKFSWTEIIQEAREESLQKNPCHLVFEIDIPRTELFTGNRLLMKQVFIALIENSIRAIKRTEDPWIRISLSLKPNLLLSISDSGPKLSEEISEFILDPFFTTEEVGRGTGLGLTTASAICHLHGGELSFNSESKNTQFILSFPTSK
ncbi:MAG: HAMP domain-containing histidine kinase [Halobacteriovoraceae bacterium]|nr:HAMP domain-containing histidine kinase [Halobacteriovoraceae bacterium]